METRYTVMTGILPPLRPWSGTRQDSCAGEEIPTIWKTHEAITFLADISMYNTALFASLDPAEKGQVRQLKSEYFKKRFTVSRCLLRYILHHITGTGNPGGIILVKEKNGPMRLTTRQDIFISLSYSGSCIAVTLGKRKIGTDIEMVLTQEIKKIRSSPLFDGFLCRAGKEHIGNTYHIWTLVEAYAKLHNMTPYPLLSGPCLPAGAGFVSYCIDRQFILSLAVEGSPVKDILLRVDPDCRLTPHSDAEKRIIAPLS